MIRSGVRRWGVLALCSALGACTYWHGDLERLADQSGRNFKIAPDKVYKHTTLGAIAAHPSSFKLMDVEFDAVVNRLDEQIFVSFYSTFRPEDYFGFSAWPAEAELWVPEQRLRSVPTLYMNKDNQDMEELLSLRRFALVRLRGRVMGDFEQRPFVEVHYVDVLHPAAYSEATLADVGAGFAAVSDGKSDEAIARLERALEGLLHGPVRGRANLELARLYEARGDYGRAAARYEDVLWTDPYNDEAWEGWTRCTEAAERQRREAAAQQP
ncbi:MAG TPA: hypothetical protein VNO22_06065 [Planctomycetota bacterium]|nr:hypothetical protein [Planctomycetota bacterium]